MNFRTLEWSYGSIFQAIVCGDIHYSIALRPKIYGRYLQFRFLKWPLISLGFIVDISILDGAYQPTNIFGGHQLALSEQSSSRQDAGAKTRVPIFTLPCSASSFTTM